MFGKKWNVLFLLIGVSIILSGIFISRQTNKEFERSHNATEHSHELISEIQKILFLVKGEQQYLITFDSSSLQANGISKVEVLNAIRNLQKLKNSNELQQSRVDSVEEMIRKIVEYIDYYSAVKRQKRFAEASQILSRAGVKDTFDQLLKKLNEMRDEENQRLQSEKESNRRNIASLNVIFTALFLILMGLMITIFMVIRHGIRNVAKQKEQELTLNKSLKELCDYWLALDESAIVGMTDEKGIFKHVNKNYCDLSGYSREEMIGHRNPTVNLGHYTPELLQDLRDHLYSGRIWRGELKNFAKDNSIYWTYSTFIPFMNEKNEPYQFLSIATDITSRKNAETSLQKSTEALAALNRDLEHKIIESVTELKTVNNELESFSYSVAHDLRAPLRVISGYASILKDEHTLRLDDEGRDFVGKIERNAKKMGDLIDDLLTFSRLGRKEIKKTTIELKHIIHESMNEIQFHSIYQGEFVLDTPHVIMADASLLTNVIINLMTNAIKYSSKREKPFIKITSQETELEVVFIIADNGVGFDMRFAQNLFGVFQRLHSPNEFEGTGIGLAIVQRIIHRHGGKVWAESKIGEGATFYFSIPKR